MTCAVLFDKVKEDPIFVICAFHLVDQATGGGEAILGVVGVAGKVEGGRRRRVAAEHGRGKIESRALRMRRSVRDFERVDSM
jgi:hypothetical protein